MTVPSGAGCGVARRDGEADQLGVTCVIAGCEANLVSLRDGWPSTTRDGPVCADYWDFNSEHGCFPDEEPEHELVTDGGQDADVVSHEPDRFGSCDRCGFGLSRASYLLPGGENVCGYHYGVWRGYINE